MCMIEPLVFFLGLGLLIYNIFILHTWVRSEKVTAKIIDVESTCYCTYNYIYEVNIDDKIIKAKGPCSYYDFLWRSKIGKKVIVRYNREENNIACSMPIILIEVIFSTMCIFFSKHMGLFLERRRHYF